jgi:proteic killer suppression protein
VIKTFRNKQLAQLWAGERSKIDARMHTRILQRLNALDDAVEPEDMNVPGYNFHGLRGSPKRYTVDVNGPWCITFGFEGTDAMDVDFEQYH